jgi:hypothetical protein
MRNFSVTSFHTESMLVLYFFYFSHSADTLIQSDLQEHLGLSALLRGTSTNFSPSRLSDSNYNLSVTVPTLLTARIPVVYLTCLSCLYSVRCLDYILDEIVLNRNANVMVASHNEDTVKHTLRRQVSLLHCMALA